MLPRVPAEMRAAGRGAARARGDSIRARSGSSSACRRRLQRDPGAHSTSACAGAGAKDITTTPSRCSRPRPRTSSHPEAWAVEREILARYALADGKPQVAYRIAAQHGLTERRDISPSLSSSSGWIALRFLHQPDMAYDHFVRLYDDGAAADQPRARRLLVGPRRRGDGLSPARRRAGMRTAAEQHHDLLRPARGGADRRARRIAHRPSRSRRRPRAPPSRRASWCKVARALAEIGADEYVRPFLRHLSDHAATPAEHALVARLATEIDRPDLAVAAAKRASYAGVTLLAEGYPIADPAAGRLGRAAAGARDDAAGERLRHRRREQRRRARPDAAHAGDREAGREVAGDPFSASRLTGDSHYNLTLGREYLSGLIDGFSGLLCPGVAAYNAGPARVREWISDFGDPRTQECRRDRLDRIDSDRRDAQLRAARPGESPGLSLPPRRQPPRLLALERSAALEKSGPAWGRPQGRGGAHKVHRLVRGREHSSAL